LADAIKTAAAILRKHRRFCEDARRPVPSAAKSRWSDIEILLIPETDAVDDPDDLFEHKIPVDYLVERP
jgi:hypothetical protein